MHLGSGWLESPHLCPPPTRRSRGISHSRISHTPADPSRGRPAPDISGGQRRAERDYKSRHAPPRPRMPSGPAFEWQVVCYSEHQLLSAPGAVRRRSASAAALARRPPPAAPRGLAGLSFVRSGPPAAELLVPGPAACGARCRLGAQGAGAAARPPRMSRRGARADDGTPYPGAPAASCQRRQGEYPALHLRPDQTCLPVLQDQVSVRGRGAGRGETKRRTRAAVLAAAARKTTSSPRSTPAPPLALLLTKPPNLPSNGVLPPRPPPPICTPTAVSPHLSPLPPNPSPRSGGPVRLQ